MWSYWLALKLFVPTSYTSPPVTAYNELEELFLPYPLDLVFLQENHSFFQAKVLCGKCLYYSDPNFKETYEENILRRAADFKPFLERYFDELLEEDTDGY